MADRAVPAPADGHPIANPAALIPESQYVHDPEPERFGTPGAPLSRSAAFYRGLWGAIGVLLAIAIALAVREIESVILLVVVSAFLAIGLNPLVEAQLRLGLKRGLAVLVVALGAIGVLALIIFVLVSVLLNQVTSFFNDGPRLLRNLLQHRWIRELNDK